MLSSPLMTNTRFRSNAQTTQTDYLPLINKINLREFINFIIIIISLLTSYKITTLSFKLDKFEELPINVGQTNIIKMDNNVIKSTYMIDLIIMCAGSLNKHFSREKS